MKSIRYIVDALEDLDKELRELMFKTNVSMKKRDDEVLLIQQQKRVLEQTLEDLTHLRDNPPKSVSACKTNEQAQG